MALNCALVNKDKYSKTHGIIKKATKRKFHPDKFCLFFAYYSLTNCYDNTMFD